jgi:hypothetical protein
MASRGARAVNGAANARFDLRRASSWELTVYMTVNVHSIGAA